MVAVNLKSLVSRLSETGRRQLEAAAGLTVSRTHYNVEIEHLLLKLIEPPGSDIALILKRRTIDPGRASDELNRALEKLRTGNARAPSLSPDIVTWLREAWILASLESQANTIRSGHLLAALIADESLSRIVRDSCPSIAKLGTDGIMPDFAELTAGSDEAREGGAAHSSASDGPPATGGESARRGTPLDQFCSDLTAQAKVGRIDPVLGRDAEIRHIIDILTRRRQNNPILTGEAGVGKTAVVEGLALRIAEGDVPDALKAVRVMALDLGLLQAGAGVKGEFENRLKGVIEAVKSSTTPIVMFIDEAHQLIGAGGQAGQNDAANLLKPALARGELRCIAATTWAEHKRYFEKDAALTRRFQVVKVDEPSEALAGVMLRGFIGTLEKHHKVRILDEAVSEAVKLSARFIPARQLPDKGISLLDTACARVAMSQASTPAPIEDQIRRLGQLETEAQALTREIATGSDHSARLAALDGEKQKTQADFAAMTSRWEREKAFVSRIGELRAEAESASQVFGSEERSEALKRDLVEASAALVRLQGEVPLVHPAVDGQAIAEVVATWTGVPVGRMLADEVKTVLCLEEKLAERIVGQDHALDAIAQAIRTSRAGLTDPRKPIGVFLMAGTSGVGKTETALALSDLLYGGDQSLTILNMSEFKEEHKVSLLMGSPPGYVGYGEGGVLTEAVRRRPYSVILLDEMEKAHPGVQDVFYQVFDKGQMKDGEGRDIDFRNCVIIMTSNAGTDTISKLCADPEMTPEPEQLREALQTDLLKVFKPAFLGRITLVPYFPLPTAIIRQIVTMQLERIRTRVRDSYRATFDWTPELVDTIAARCTESSAGARNVENILTRTLLPELSAEVLARLADGKSIQGVKASLNTDGLFFFAIN